MWKAIYQAPASTHWVGRKDAPEGSAFFQVVELSDFKKIIKPKCFPAFALVGFASDAGVKRNVGRTGAKAAPDAIRKALGPFSCKRKEIALYDFGNVVCHRDELEEAQLALAEIIEKLLNENITPIVLGGGHEVAYGNYLGIARKISDLAIVNFDAHFDMRPLLNDAKGSSGTPFLQIAEDKIAKGQLFDYTCLGLQMTGNNSHLDETARKHHVHALYASEIHENGLSLAKQMVADAIKRTNQLYVSLCLDVFATPFAPGVSAPQILGLFPWQVISLLRILAESKKVVSYDLAEYCPPLDIDMRTAKLAASLVSEIIHHHGNEK